MPKTFSSTLLFKQYSNFVFLSPHYDDAVLSCAELLLLLKRHKKKVLLVSIFTKASAPPFTKQAKIFISACHFTKAGALFSQRKKEDLNVIKKLGISYHHLNYIDAAFRKNNLYSFLPESLKNIRLLAPLTHVYPSSSSQFSGVLHQEDKTLIQDLTEQIQDLKKPFTSGKTLYLCPLGIGGHADHILVRETAKKLGQEVLFWEDFPYNIHHHLRENFFHLEKDFQLHLTLPSPSFSKERLIRLYRSQMQLLFPKGKIPKQPERYYALSNAKRDFNS